MANRFDFAQWEEIERALTDGQSVERTAQWATPGRDRESMNYHRRCAQLGISFEDASLVEKRSEAYPHGRRQMMAQVASGTITPEEAIAIVDASHVRDGAYRPYATALSVTASGVPAKEVVEIMREATSPTASDTALLAMADKRNPADFETALGYARMDAQAAAVMDAARHVGLDPEKASAWAQAVAGDDVAWTLRRAIEDGLGEESIDKAMSVYGESPERAATAIDAYRRGLGEKVAEPLIAGDRDEGFARDALRAHAEGFDGLIEAFEKHAAASTPEAASVRVGLLAACKDGCRVESAEVAAEAIAKANFEDIAPEEATALAKALDQGAGRAGVMKLAVEQAEGAPRGALVTGAQALAEGVSTVEAARLLESLPVDAEKTAVEQAFRAKGLGASDEVAIACCAPGMGKAAIEAAVSAERAGVPVGDIEAIGKRSVPEGMKPAALRALADGMERPVVLDFVRGQKGPADQMRAAAALSAHQAGMDRESAMRMLDPRVDPRTATYAATAQRVGLREADVQRVLESKNAGVAEERLHGMLEKRLKAAASGSPAKQGATVGAAKTPAQEREAVRWKYEPPRTPAEERARIKSTTTDDGPGDGGGPGSPAMVPPPPPKPERLHVGPPERRKPPTAGNWAKSASTPAEERAMAKNGPHAASLAPDRRSPGRAR